VAHLPRPDRAAGVFETILVVDGAPVELDTHLRRLRASVGELFGVEPPPAAREALLAEAAPLSLGRVRLTVLPRPEGVLALEALAGPVDPDDVFPVWDRAAAMAPFVMRGGLGPHKWADRAALERMSASAGGRLPLILDAGAEVLEAARANVFAVEGDAFVTPPLDGRILAGVARARVLAAAGALGVAVREEALPLKRLLASDGAFLTGSLRGVEPVRRVGEAELAPTGDAVARVAAAVGRAWIGERSPARRAGGFAAGQATGPR
jgi:branched-subunit amino acid aminotransferase/4-amino-4-deoxychorismate lyase